MYEHIAPECDVVIDLDCDDSSGAGDFDYNSNEFTCLTDGLPVSDYDIGLVYDAIIEEMRIELTGFMPDAPFEILTLNGNVTNLDVDGEGTTMITLTNAGGARGSDYKEALRLIRYENTIEMPTGGQRTVEVQFTTSSGAESNVAIAYIEVAELPLIPVDLGDNVQVCEGESATFDAGIPDAEYEWSTGDDTQAITVSESGEYIVTVADGENCPGIDTVVLEVLPIIDVSLSGDTEICDNENATIIINTSTPFGLDIDISSEPGAPFNFPNVTGTTSFTDLVNEETTYTITSVNPSQDACVTISDPEHIIDVYPSFIHTVEANICDGDSVWLGFYWETEPGLYENTFDSYFGCDSIVTTTIAVLPEIPVSVAATTCDTAEVGVFITVIDNPNGCDTVVTTTTTLVSMDTTEVTAVSCRLAEVGVSHMWVPGSDGCDSLIITTIAYIPPTDTTYVSAVTCDSGAVGVTQWVWDDSNNCDSLVVTTTMLASPDTTYAFGTSCDTALIGVTQVLLQKQNGCDSLVISTITAGMADTTYAAATSCDSATLGTFETHFLSIHGCDSVVFLTVLYSAVDSTFASGTTCDPGTTGIYVEHFINQYGCDSIVTTTISLLASDSVSLSGTTCDPTQAGVSIQELQNVNGCDSIVTTTISLLPTSHTALFETTCISANAGVFVTTLLNQYGCDSTVTTTVSLVNADTTRLTYLTCFKEEVGVEETLLTSSDGCDSLIVSTTTLYPGTLVTLATLYDYNGYDISCEGAEDGGILANVTGTPPYTYLWSTGSPDHQITGLSAGQYAVTVTDGNGCTETGEVTLTEPSDLALTFSISEPDCFENGLGTITAIASGGVGAYTYSLDGFNFQHAPVFENLQSGIYQITALDANDCETREIVSIHVPISIQVELGDNQVIAIGDSAEITAVINLPFDSIASINWHGIDSIECPNCLTQIVAPVITTAYSISVSSLDGCADSDTMTVLVATGHNFYIPNIFSPNGDGVNDVITVYTSDDVKAILAFSIFDRWGNLVFERNEADIAIEWDGRFNQKTCNPGVFTYKAVVRYRDDRTEVRYGDITLLR